MKLSKRQRSILLAVLGITLSALLFSGGFHHHEGDIGKGCWYCVAAAMALLPVSVLVFAPALHAPPARLEVARIPAWFLWVSHYRRGPPQPHHG